jgi:hypothetical protein
LVDRVQHLRHLGGAACYVCKSHLLSPVNLLGYMISN